MDGAVTASLVGPSRDAQLGDASGHGQDRHDDAVDDEVILIPAIFSAAAALGKVGTRWEPSAALYLLLNALGMGWAVGHQIMWLTWIPAVWLVLYWKEVSGGPKSDVALPNLK